MYVAGVLAKIAKDIPKRILPKMSRNKSFYLIARFEAIYSASKTRVLVLKYTTTGNRLLIYEFVNIGAFVSKLRCGGSFYVKAIRFKIPKQFHS